MGRQEIKQHLNIYKLILNKRQTYPTVSKRIQYFKKMQEHKLVSMGVYGKTNAPMTKFILSANYGYAEKTESKNINENTVVWKETKTYEDEN